jgi:hypothetical protein
MKQSACSPLNISHLPNPRIRIEEKPEEDEKKIVDVLKKETRRFTYEKFLLNYLYHLQDFSYLLFFVAL